MSNSILLQNAQLVNEGKVQDANVLVRHGRISQILPLTKIPVAEHKLDLKGNYLLPGVIDDQVHFREPGLTHKGELFTESSAAAAGGVTTYMEMPNTVPSATTIEKLEAKYQRAAEVSAVNYSFYMGTTNENLAEVLKIDPEWVCGVKIFMGSSTGDMLVDAPGALEGLFREVKSIITVHCEDDPMVKKTAAEYRERLGEDLPTRFHAMIRSREACFSSSSKAVELAKKYGTRLHILHISTADELELFDNRLPLKEKKITAEACIHHLWFEEEDYDRLGNFIKWNPAVKTAKDREAIRQAVKDGRIDVVATDHAPHTLAEKQQSYWQAPSGGPLIQHSLQAMFDLVKSGVFSPELVVEKMCHSPAELFRIRDRGYVREDYWADLAILSANPYSVRADNLLYKCKWSPFLGHTFSHSVQTTLVNGQVVWHQGKLFRNKAAQRIQFNV